MQAFLLAREAARMTPDTLHHYRYTVGTFVSWLHEQGLTQVDQITPNHVRAYLVQTARRGVKDTTQHVHARGIRTWFNWLVREGDLDTSPMKNVPMPKLEKRIPPPFTAEDIQKLLDACDRRTVRGARNYAMILVALDTGLRVHELVGLQVGSIDMRSGVATVIGKGRKQRQVRVGADARSAILKYLGFRGHAEKDEPLWLTHAQSVPEPRPMTVKGAQIMFQRLGRIAGVQPCGPHRFRRTFALWCLRDGMDLHSLRLLMGHSTLSVLQTYLALAGEDIERAHIAHSPVDKLFAQKRRR